MPTFAFEDSIDPIALQQTLARLSPYFRRDTTSTQLLSNAMMTQAARMNETPAPAERPAVDLGREVGGEERTEDLFVFTVDHVTLKKGERMVLPVTGFELPYDDVYSLDIAAVPPPEVFNNFNSSQRRELARLLESPKVMHKVRLKNTSDTPLTTAPALVFRDERVLGQGLMTYTSVGGTTDLPITAAVDVSVNKTDHETERVPQAVRWNGNDYSRVDLAGAIELRNHRERAVRLEVVRYVLGNATGADHDGLIEMVNVLEDLDYSAPRPAWWGWYNWPYWWRHFNGIGRIEWKLALDPGERVRLGYDWNYYWR